MNINPVNNTHYATPSQDASRKVELADSTRRVKGDNNSERRRRPDRRQEESNEHANERRRKIERRRALLLNSKSGEPENMQERKGLSVNTSA